MEETVSNRALLTILAASAAALAGCSPAAHTSLLSVDAMPPGAQCPAGGARVRSGIDLNGDGRLEDNEVTSTSYICNGASASGGSQATLVRVVPEPAGSNCPDGGSAVEAGLDTNGDGVLESGEVTSTSYVCDGKAGVLVRVGSEPAGSHCLRGGTVIKSGFDSNHDGVLEDGEVSSTSYVCNPVPTALVGDVTIAAAADVAQLTGVPRVEGSLIVKAPDLTQLYLPDLVEIVGDFKVTTAANTLAAIRLPRLVTVGGAVDIEASYNINTPSIAELTLPALRSANSFYTSGAQLTTLSLEALTTVAGKLTISGAAFTAFPTLAGLNHVGGFEISNNGNIDKLTLPTSLREVDGDVTIDANIKITFLWANGLLVHGGFEIGANSALTGFNLSGTHVDGTFKVDLNDALGATADSTLITPASAYAIHVEQNTHLLTLPLELEDDLLQSLTVRSNVALTDIIDYRNLRTINSLSIQNNGSLTKLDLTRLSYAFSVLVWDNQNLPSCLKTKFDAQVTVGGQDYWTGNNDKATCN
jgi:hypothetical protein